MIRAACLLVLSVLLVSCSDSPTAPSNEPPPNNNPPAQTLYTLTGIVSSAASGPIGGATVTISDGPNAGKTTTTAGDGRYTLTDLTFAGFSVSVSAANHDGQSRGIALNAAVTTATANFSLLPSALWSFSGAGNSVFDMPTYIRRVRIQGVWNRTQTSNFIVRIAGSLVVNEILRNSITYDGVHLTNGGVVSITNSGQIAWTFTEVR